MKKHIRCRHGKIKFTCRKCAPNSFCSHGKANTRCAECGGGSICIHNKARQVCRECNPIGWVKQALLRAKKNCIEKGINPPNITAEEMVLLASQTTHCCGCKQPLVFDGRQPHALKACLHHNHQTGEVVGFAHSICNLIEGKFLLLTLEQRICLLDNFFPETTSKIEGRK